MQTRSSFTVYVDTPSSPVASPTTSAATTPVSEPAELPATTLVSLANKENVHPLTGERATHKSDGKKRKTGVLAVKTVLVDEQPEPLVKKRKGIVPVLGSSSSSSSSTASRVRVKKGRRTTKKSSRNPTPLPKVDEDSEDKTLSQAAIDSRCYELTVSPLADVSDAYLHTFHSLADDVHSDTPFVRDASTEPQLRDYFSPSPNRLPPSKSSSRDRSQEPKVFSTPERKQIYSAFTFSSPSPSSERYKNAQLERAGSVPPLVLTSQKASSSS